MEQRSQELQLALSGVHGRREARKAGAYRDHLADHEQGRRLQLGRQFRDLVQLASHRLAVRLRAARSTSQVRLVARMQ